MFRVLRSNSNEAAEIVRDALVRGVFSENPLLVCATGLCPALAISTTLPRGFTLGAAMTVALACSNALISMLRAWIPASVRIPCHLVVIAAVVTVVDILLRSSLPGMSDSLGIYIPLIAVFCVVLERGNVFASRNTVFHSVVDGCVVGIGFCLPLCLIAGVREIVGSGSLAGIALLPAYPGIEIVVIAPGGFLALGFAIGIVNFVKAHRRHRA